MRQPQALAIKHSPLGLSAQLPIGALSRRISYKNELNCFELSSSSCTLELLLRSRASELGHERDRDQRPSQHWNANIKIGVRGDHLETREHAKVLGMASCREGQRN